MQAMLSALIFFSTDTVDKDPLTCHGRPRRRRQKLMRELKLIDKLMQSITEPERVGYALKDFVIPRNASMLRTHRLLLKCLTHSFLDLRRNEDYVAAKSFASWMNSGEDRDAEAESLAEHSKQTAKFLQIENEITNGTGLTVEEEDEMKESLAKHEARTRELAPLQHEHSRYMTAIMRQLGYDCGASQCLEKLLTNNRSLLETAVGEDTVRVFVELIKDKGPEAIFLQFMSALCSCKGRQIVSNQEHMLRVLYSFCATNENIVKAKAEANGADEVAAVNAIAYADCAHNRNELLMDTCLDYNAGPDGTGSRVVGGVTRDLREWGATAEDPERYLGRACYEEGMRDIRVSWSSTDVWDGEIDDTLFYSPTGLGLGSFVRPTEESGEMGKTLKANGFSAPRHLTDYLAATKTIAEAQQYEPDASAGAAKREWVRLEELVWPLDPEGCYPVVFSEQIANERRSGGNNSSIYRFADTWHEFKEQVLVDTRMTLEESRGLQGAAVVEAFKRHTQIANYYLANLELMSEMATGRSYNCLHALEHHFSYDLLLTGMTNDALPYSIRRAFTDLVLRLWVDRYPHTPLQVPQGVRVLADIEERPTDEEGLPWIDQPNTLPCFQIEENNPILRYQGEQQFVDFYTIPDGDKFHLLEDFVSDHFNALQLRMVFEDKEKTQFTKAVIGVLEKLSEFGFFADTGEVSEVMDPLIGLLDGRGDCLTNAEAEMQDLQEREAMNHAVDITKKSMAKGRGHHIWGHAKRADGRETGTRRQSMKEVTARRSVRRASAAEEKEQETKASLRRLQTATGQNRAAADMQRYHITEQSERVMASKVKMCEVTGFFHNVQLDFRLGALLAKVKDSVSRKRSMTGERQSTLQNKLFRIYEGAADPPTEQFEGHMAFCHLYASKAQMAYRYTQAMDADHGSDMAGREEGGGSAVGDLLGGGGLGAIMGAKEGLRDTFGDMTKMIRKNTSVTDPVTDPAAEAADDAEHKGDEISTLDAEEGYCLTQSGFHAVQSLFAAQYDNLDLDHLSRAPLVTVCFDLQQYHSPQLFVASMASLVSHFTQRRQLKEHIGQIQLLTTEFSINAHEELRDNLAMLTSDLESYEMWGVANEFSGIDDEVVRRVVGTLDSLVTLCVRLDGSPDSENQDLFGNMRVHDTILKALDINITHGELESRTGHLYAIKSLCYRFLRDFVIDHAANQAKVFEYLRRTFNDEREAFMLASDTGTQPKSKHFGHGFCMSELVAATFRNNRKLCTLKSRVRGGNALEQVVSRFIGLIKAEGSAYGSRFLQLFCDVVQVDGSLLRANQEMVLQQLTAPQHASKATVDAADSKEDAKTIAASGTGGAGVAANANHQVPKATVLMRNEVCLLLMDQEKMTSASSYDAAKGATNNPPASPALGRSLTTMPDPLSSVGFQERQRMCRNYNPILVDEMPALQKDSGAAAVRTSLLGGAAAGEWGGMGAGADASEHSASMSNPLVANSQACHDTNRLYYHCQVVELLATCAKRNQVTQVKCQQLFPLDVVLAVLTDNTRDSHPVVRKAFCKFLNATYIHTDIIDFSDVAVSNSMLRQGGVVDTLLQDLQQFTSEATASLATGGYQSHAAADAAADDELMEDGRGRAMTATQSEVRGRKSTAVMRAEKHQKRSRKSEELAGFAEYIFTAALPLLTAVSRRWYSVDEASGGKKLLMPLRWRGELTLPQEAALLARLQESVRSLVRCGAYSHSGQRHAALLLGASLRLYEKDQVERLLQNAQAAEEAEEEAAQGVEKTMSVERDVLRRFSRAMSNSREYAQAEAVEWRQLVGAVFDIEKLTDAQQPDYLQAKSVSRQLKAKELLAVTADHAGGANLAHMTAQGEGRVKIDGLLSKPELNGSYGTAMQYGPPKSGDASMYRYTVLLPDGTQIALKPENVKLAKPDATADGAGNPMHSETDGKMGSESDSDDEEDVLARAKRWSTGDPWERMAEAATADRRRNKITVEMVVKRIVEHVRSAEGLDPKVTAPQLCVDMMLLLRGMMESREYPLPEEFVEQNGVSAEDEDLNEEEREQLQAAYVGLQDDFDHWGVTKMIVDVISNVGSTDEMVIGAMELCCAMLNGGNQEVQDTLYDYLVGESNVAFFERMHDRLCRAVTDMEQRRKAQKQAEAKGATASAIDQVDVNDRDLDGTGLSKSEALAQGFVSETNADAGGYIPPDLALLEGEEFDAIRMDLVGRMLQLFAEGHNLRMQNIMRSQQQGRGGSGKEDGVSDNAAENYPPVNFKESFNLVQKAVDLLAVTASNENAGAIPTLDDDDAEDLEKVIDFLIEAMQGPCQRNQAMLAESGMVEICVNLIKLLPTYAKNEESGVFEVVDSQTGVSAADMAAEKAEAAGMSSSSMLPVEVASEEWAKKVKAVAAKALSALLEGSGAEDTTVQRLLMAKLPPRLVRDRLVRVYQNFEEKRMSFANQTDDNYDEWRKAYLDEGFDLLTTANALSATFPGSKFAKAMAPALEPTEEQIHGKKQQYVSKGGEALFITALFNAKTRKRFKKAHQFFDGQLGSVEVFWNGSLDKVYFPLPSCTEFLKQETKAKIESELDLGDDDRVRAFVHAGPAGGKTYNVQILQDELEHYEDLNQLYVYKLLGSNLAVLKNCSYYLALMMNFLMVLSLEKCTYKGQDGCDANGYRYAPSYMQYVQLGMGVLQVTTSCLVLAFKLMNRAPLVFRERRRERKVWVEKLQAQMMGNMQQAVGGPIGGASTGPGAKPPVGAASAAASATSGAICGSLRMLFGLVEWILRSLVKDGEHFLAAFGPAIGGLVFFTSFYILLQIRWRETDFSMFWGIFALAEFGEYYARTDTRTPARTPARTPS
jgi:hypothetical protein